MYTETKRVEYLDSIRGLAALFVLLCHTAKAFEWPPNYVSLLNLPFVYILFDGKAAVVMFFVLSGYVLSKPYVVSPTTTRKIFLPTFYLRRFMRIWIPWFFVFLCSLIACKIFFALPTTEPPVTKWWLGKIWLNSFPLSASDFFRQCAFLLHDANRQLLPQDWSLGVELKGSALIPLFLFLAYRQRVYLLFLLATFLLFFVGTGHYYVSFIIGVLLAQYGDWLSVRFMTVKRSTRIGVLLIGLLLYQAYSVIVVNLHETPLTLKLGWSITGFGCALIMLSVFSSPTLQRILNQKAIVLLGRISYSIYLIQFIVILCLLLPLLKIINGWGVHQPAIILVFLLLVSVLVTVGCAALTYRYIEVPTINWGHRLTKKIQSRFQK